MTIEDEKTIKALDIFQTVMCEDFIEQWDSGKLKNKGDKQLEIAVLYFRIEVAKRRLLKKTI